MRATRRPATKDDWQALRDELLDLFAPGAPIDEVALFSGRREQIQRLRDTLVSKGRHAAVFGERGVGKTSLAKIFHLDRPSPQRIHHIYIQCLVNDTFDSI